ncbi:mucin-like protein [Orbicella faveolata]|uniref:mucin-like protein n=1 Tax=Orbicella faveolata TaxID=48498 RepID=UPI0009E5F374|nr:mucin-like protein [Orbicella faveolata]
MVLGRSKLPLIVVVVCTLAIPLFFIAKRASLNGGYTIWNGWGACSSDCGEGIRIRTRTCTNPIAGRFGKTCLQLGLGEPQEEEKCKLKECPIDGGFTDWGEYGVCSKPCGTDGVKKRTRTCTNPLPQFGGKPCEGTSEETQPCNVKPCPVDGAFSEWGSFEDCDKTCGSGIKRRTRTCTNPPPSHGGKNCEGAVDQVEECNTQPCPVNGAFSAWSEFGSCSVSCGSGVQARNRTCSQPAPAHGGKDCEGPAGETKECNTDPCPPVST